MYVREDGERGVRSLKLIKSGQFDCEFEGNLLTKGECEVAEKEYEKEGKGSIHSRGMEEYNIIFLVFRARAISINWHCITNTIQPPWH